VTSSLQALVTFRELLEDAFLQPDRADFSQLRAHYVQSAEYAPYGHASDAVEALHRHLEAAAWEDAITAAEDILALDPLSIAVRLAYAHALEGVDDDWEAATQRAVANGLVRAILRSGDGASEASALLVLDDREVPLILDVLGTTGLRSRLEIVDERHVLCVTCADQRDRFFDVSWPQRWLGPSD